MIEAQLNFWFSKRAATIVLPILMMTLFCFSGWRIGFRNWRTQISSLLLHYSTN